MAKVTSKLQVTIPKSLAEEHRIKPGDEIEWNDAGDSIRITPTAASAGRTESVEKRLKLFDEATARQRRRRRSPRTRKRDRGWTREDLYDRGRSR